MINIECFKMPIEYIENKVSLEANIVDDLELLNTKDASATPIYDIVFSPEHVFSKETIKLWAKYYTSDKNFLDDSKKLIKNFKQQNDATNNNNNNNNDNNNNDNNKFYDVKEKFNKINQIYKEVTNDNGFYEKYQYIDSSWFKWLNNDGKFLQILSLYNLTSPVISLILPIIFLIIPFFILKLTKVPIDMNTYLTILKQLFSRHPLGQAFMHFKDAPVDKKFYITMSLAFYFFQIYQNFMICIRFYKNLYKIHNYLFELKDYINYTLDTFDNFDSQCKNLTSYQMFIDNMRENKTILNKLKQELEKITPWKLNLYKVTNIGQVMKCFYNLYDDKQLKNTLTYSFGFHGYIDNIDNLKKKLDKRQIAMCKFSKNANANANANKKSSKEKTKFKNAYFPSVIENPVKNTYSLDKQLLITGPNAAGKTTLLKTTFFNILFSQQAGVGFYSKATITPFSYLHCYLNIPDTSGRDSLFQAEARRCKDILNIIEKSNQNEKHFCIFDELYSGTNPYEAISAAVSFLRYLNKYNNVSYILTTHFIDLCKKLDNNEKNSNHHMNIIEKENDFKYTYELKKGISNVKGGVKVLKDLDYPEEIINSTKQLIQEINI